MFRKTTLVAALLVAAAGLTAYAVGRGLSAPSARGFTIHSKSYRLAPDGTRTDTSTIDVYVSAAGDVREVERHAGGEQTETIKLVGEGAVYRVGGRELHYVGQWAAPSRGASQGMPAGRFEPGRLLGYDVGWATTKAGTRYAIAPALHNQPLYVQVFDKGIGGSFVTEAYAVDESEPPAHLFRRPDLPVSREAFEKMEAQRDGRGREPGRP